MLDPTHPALRQAVEAVTPQGLPDFQKIAALADRRKLLFWSGAGIVAVAAAAAVVVLLQPAPPPGFDTQVTAFVELVYRD